MISLSHARTSRTRARQRQEARRRQAEPSAQLALQLVGRHRRRADRVHAFGRLRRERELGDEPRQFRDVQRLNAPSPRSEARRKRQRGERAEEIAGRAAGADQKRRPHDRDFEPLDRAEHVLGLALGALKARRVVSPGAESGEMDEPANAGKTAGLHEPAHALDMHGLEIVDPGVARQAGAIDDDFRPRELGRERGGLLARDIEFVVGRRHDPLSRLEQRDGDVAADKATAADKEYRAHERSPRQTYFVKMLY